MYSNTIPFIPVPYRNRVNEYARDLKRFQNIRKRTVALCEPLSAEDCVVQSAAFTSPPKWHLAHTTWFFEEFILRRRVMGYEEFSPDFGFLFNSYYNSFGNRTLRAERGLITRPSLEEVMEYREYVDSQLIVQYENGFVDEVDEAEFYDLIELGLNHEQQHQELLLSDLKYTFSYNPTHPVYDATFELVTGYNKRSSYVTVDEGVYQVGHQGSGFCFDNELGAHKVYLQAYKISHELVTNGDYLEFMQTGAYENFRYWLDDGWTWIQKNKKKAPLYWQQMEGRWYHYTFSGLKEIDPMAILSHVSFYEANAYATWKGTRLPTEFEWEVASKHLTWGLRWEWTNSAYLPYPGYKMAKGALGEYNGKFMINQMVLRGASIVTPFGHSRSTYRNFFQPECQWQFSGVRLIVE